MYTYMCFLIFLDTRYNLTKLFEVKKSKKKNQTIRYESLNFYADYIRDIARACHWI